jgi:hypothetical protein
MASTGPEPQPNPLKPDPNYDDYDFPTNAPEPQTGHPGWTTPEQDAQVFQLRSMLEQEGYKERLDTLTLLRFLRARKFNVQASKEMYVHLLMALLASFAGCLGFSLTVWVVLQVHCVREVEGGIRHKFAGDGVRVYRETAGV